MSAPALIAGRYELIDDPIRGSMGEIYRAHDTHLDREVAVKLIHRDLLGSDLESELVRRFHREARLTAQAAHPGVPAVYDIGVDADRHYVVMEHITGATVRDLINEIPDIPIGWIVFITAQVCAVLARTHAISLIHRDLKPDNIMLATDGTIKVIDFGTAILVDGSPSSSLTPPGVTAGDLRYQAPERFLGIATPRSDLYSLGRILHEMLTDPAAPPDLHRLAEDLTHEQPQHRPANAIEVYQRLHPSHQPLPPLPGFVTRPVDAPLRMYHHLAVLLDPPQPTAEPGAAATRGRADRIPAQTPRQARARAENHAADGQFNRATAILDAAIADIDAQDPAAVDLYRDLARVLMEAGNAVRAIVVCQTAVDAMRECLPDSHPAMQSLRLMQARAHAANGETEKACDLYAQALNQMRAGGQLQTPTVIATRRELAMQFAAQGERARAAHQLHQLLAELSTALGPHDPELQATKEAAAMVAVARGRAP